jgi:hypothetical protein
MAVVVKGSTFWDVEPYIPLKVGRRFGGTCQGRRMSGTKQISTW